MTDFDIFLFNEQYEDKRIFFTILQDKLMYIDYFFSVGLWNWHGLEGRGCSQFCWRGSQSQHP